MLLSKTLMLALSLATLPTPGVVLAKPPAPTTAPVPTEDDKKTQAAAAKQRGDSAMVQANPAEALKAYEEAYTLAPDAALLYNRARALQALERYPEALKLIEQFAKEASPELRARVPKLVELTNEIKNKSSGIQLACNVKDAEVLLGTVVLGKTPLAAKLDWNAGSYELTVRHPDYHEYKKTIELPPGGVATIDVVLNLKATTTLLQVSSPVVGASIKIDGEGRGTVPYEDYLSFGTHQIEITSDGYTPANQTVVLNAGEPKVIAIELSPIPKFYQRWYFWTAAAVVVAGGVALGVASQTEKPAKAGTLGISSVGLTGVSF